MKMTESVEENRNNDCAYYITRIQELEIENQQLKEKLKSYTAPDRSKRFYENHKEEIKQRTREYKETLSQEKRKQYARTAYLNKKEKQRKAMEVEGVVP
jgi:hypothetical protein